MKQLLIFTFSLLVLGFQSCSKENGSGNGNNISEWVIGDTTELEKTKTFQITTNSTIEFRTEESSLCPTHGVQVIIKEDNNELFNEEIKNHPSSFNINVPENSIIEVHTQVVPLNPQPFILCKRLGDIKCVVEF